MTTAEEKLDLLVTKVKNLQLNQVKLITKVDAINTWSITAEKTAGELSNTMKSLTSRIAALEAATSTAPPPAPTREEGGRAIGHRFKKIHWGADPGPSTPDHTLVKGENQKPKPIQFDVEFPEHSDRKYGFHASQTSPRDYKLPRIDFPTFEGEHTLWREKCEKYFSMFNVPIHVWVPFITINSKAMLSCGYKLMKHNILLIVGLNYVWL